MKYNSKLRSSGPIKLQWAETWHTAPDQIVIPRDVASASEVRSVSS